MTDDWLLRLTQKLEPILRTSDPRPQISAYHDMPYAIFRYPPEDEFAVRKQVTLLRTRLEQSGKHVSRRVARGVHDAAPRTRRALTPRHSRRPRGGPSNDHRDGPRSPQRVRATRRAGGGADRSPMLIRSGTSSSSCGLERCFLSTVLVPSRTTQGQRARPSRPLLPGRARRRRRPALHGRFEPNTTTDQVF